MMFVRWFFIYLFIKFFIFFLNLQAGQGKVGTDEIEFVRILCSRSYSQLRVTFEEYYRFANTDIEKAIKKEDFSNLVFSF